MRCDNSDFPERAAWCNDYFACGGCQPVGTAARLAVGNGHRLFHRARIEDRKETETLTMHYEVPGNVPGGVML